MLPQSAASLTNDIPYRVVFKPNTKWVKIQTPHVSPLLDTTKLSDVAHITPLFQRIMCYCIGKPVDLPQGKLLHPTHAMLEWAKIVHAFRAASKCMANSINAVAFSLIPLPRILWDFIKRFGSAYFGISDLLLLCKIVFALTNERDEITLRLIASVRDTVQVEYMTGKLKSQRVQRGSLCQPVDKVHVSIPALQADRSLLGKYEKETTNIITQMTSEMIQRRVFITDTHVHIISFVL